MSVHLVILLDFLTESEEALLKMSVSQPESGAAVLPDFSSMTEEEQIAYAMQMSLAGGGEIHLTALNLCASLLKEFENSVVIKPSFPLLFCEQSMEKWTQELPWILQIQPR